MFFVPFLAFTSDRIVLSHSGVSTQDKQHTCSQNLVRNRYCVISIVVEL